MSLKLKDKAQLNKFILGQSKVIENALIYALEYLVAKFQNHAKENAGYKDRTANLKSSIGGAVVKDGKIVSYVGFEKTGRQVGLESSSLNGTQIGKTFLDSLLGNIGSGYGIIMVAGMEYATYVENLHNLNVLAKTELILKKEMDKMFLQLKKKMEGNKFKGSTGSKFKGNEGR